MNRKYKLKIITALCGFVILFAFCFVAFNLLENVIDNKRDGDGDEFSFSDEAAGELYYNSEWYVTNKSIESYLILGIDKMVGDVGGKEESEQTDFIALLLLDKSDETFSIIQINRDTMSNVPQKDISGKTYGTVYEQLALAHTYGTTDRERCRNTVVTVEDLLYGVDIDHYLSITMDAVAILNDSVGGVEVEVMDDFSAFDSALKEGAVVTLRGDQALTYVRARSGLEDSTNLRRMERQKQYVNALFDKFVTLDEVDLIETVTEINDYLASDCTVDQMSRLLERLEKFTFEGIITLPGEAKKGEKYVEYYLDDTSVREIVIEHFYEKKN